jgi:hypothetical protein
MTRGKRVSLACLLALMGAVSALAFASVAAADPTAGGVGHNTNTGNIEGSPGQADCKNQSYGDTDAVVVIKFSVGGTFALPTTVGGTSTATVGGYTVTITALSIGQGGNGPVPTSVSFTSNGQVAGVLVHAGSNGTFYNYEALGSSTLRFGDSGIHDMENKTFSSISFCFDAGSALGVQFRSLKALAARGGVLVRWATGTEVDVLGFNVYREVKGLRVKANKSLIVAKAGTTGHSYSWLDRAAKKSNRYWVQAVNGNGTRSWIGPARVARA